MMAASHERNFHAQKQRQAHSKPTDGKLYNRQNTPLLSPATVLDFACRQVPLEQ